MSLLRSLFRQRAVRLYLLGHALILLGAWLIALTGSMLPMALASSAALMMTAPLVRRLGARLMRRRP